MYENLKLYDEFFKNLGIEVVYSQNTNTEILNDGIEFSVSENCLASKIFMGHVVNLIKRSDKEKIDYIFIPRIAFFSKRETTCVKFYALYDICKNVFDSKFLCLDVDYSKYKNPEMVAFLKLGKRLGFDIPKVLSSYLRAKRKEREDYILRYQKQLEKISINTKNVLIVAHSYIAYDSFLTSDMYNYLKNNGINVIFADINGHKFEKSKNNSNKKGEYKKISSGIYWRYNKELLEGIVEYSKIIDGAIFITSFPCGIDSLVNELAIRYLKDIPTLNLIIDEQTANAGMLTRLESFVDILNQTQDKYEVKSS